MIPYKKQAIESFLKHDYAVALRWYALALKEDPKDQEVKIGAMLCDMASDNEEEAQALFEYFLITKKEEDAEKACEIVESILLSIDSSAETLHEVFAQALEYRLLSEDGIAYEDFLALVEAKGDFKIAFEDIMFSTKVLITHKEDFIDFLNHLIENGFNEMAYSYLEGALKAYPQDAHIRSLCEKLTTKESHE